MPTLRSEVASAERVRSVIFDLDGTLVDSLPGIEESATIAIKQVLPDEPVPELRAVIGPPVAAMFAGLWPELEPLKMGNLVAAFRAHYLAEGCLKTTPFPAVPETLSALLAAGLQLFVLTNKPAAPTERILNSLDLARFFSQSLSPDSVSPPYRAKADGARKLMEDFQLSAAETALVGDGADDAISAQACGFRFIGAAYGYGSAGVGAPLRIEKFSELEHLLL